MSGRLLVVHHSPTELLREALGEVLAGARHPDLAGVAVVEVPALAATSDDLLAADAILLGTPANFGYLSGALKHFFDSTFADCAEARRGLPFGYWIRGGQDTTGAERAMKAITTGFGWRAAAEPVCFTGGLDAARRAALAELGGTLAAHALAGPAGGGR